MTDIPKIEFTENTLDAVATPILAFTSVALIAAQIDELGRFDTDCLEGSRTWPTEMRDHMLDDAEDRLVKMRDWIEQALKVTREEQEFDA